MNIEQLYKVTYASNDPEEVLTKEDKEAYIDFFHALEQIDDKQLQLKYVNSAQLLLKLKAATHSKKVFALQQS